jgi:hypothetical protein
MIARLTTAALYFALATAGPAFAASPDWQQVDTVLGRQGAEQEGGVRRYSFPRSDLRVTLDGVRIQPALALGSWLAFREMGDHVEVMGDLVLTHDEVNPVLSRLLEGGLTITALHNHLLHSQPGTMYMHIHGHGDAVRMAQTIRAALAASRTPTSGGSASAPARQLTLDTASLDRILGATGRANGGVYGYSIPRAHPILQNGKALPASLGLGTVINFQPTGSGRAAITGDFVLIEPEVTPVLRALRANGIQITALHNHMTGEEPRLFFMHFWANADAGTLARGLRQALEATASRSSR